MASIMTASDKGGITVEKHLGWIVGGVGTLLLGAMLPVMAATVSTPNSEGSTQGSIQGHASSTTHTVAATPFTQLPPGARFEVTSGSHDLRPNQNLTGQEKVREVVKLAKMRVGGGQVTQIEPQKRSSQGIWNVRIAQPNGTWQVKVSMSDYSVVQVDKLGSSA
jgi:hypothetical protein